MKVAGRDRGGIVIGSEALDVTALYEVIGQRGEWIDKFNESAVLQHLEIPYIDALDLYQRYDDRLHRIVRRLTSDSAVAARCRAAGALKPLDEVKLNPPVLAPGKILAVGLNYAAHAAEQNLQPPEVPLIFSKNVTALIGPGDSIQLPRISEKVDYEAELAVVIGKEAKSVTADRALDYVAGYTIMNDVTARDLQRSERQWARAKGLDTFGPCGPYLVTKDEIPDPQVLDLELRVNGDVRQSSNTNDLIFNISQIVQFVSQDLTLKPGDIISTGTPSGVGVYRDPPVFLKGGEEIEINISGIGVLRNPVVARPN
jgi:2-keto-4-pentenoate hydratase/2-oxohepta-3-ene-1,7-dioic acid hydratase in catechol pathway